MKVYIIVLIFILICSCSSENIDSRLDEMFSEYNSSGLPGAAVAIIKDGKIIKEKYYGLADVKNSIPINQKTNFRLASVTKQFTAMCILQLAEENKLSLSSTLTDFFPDFPHYGRKITIENLLNHTSGLVDYENLISDSALIQVKDKDVLKMMMEIDSVYFSPGETFQYSNTGYALLTQIIEKIEGKTFGEYLNEKIFIPAGMQNTIAFENGINTVKNRAYGYTISEDSILFTDQSITSAVLGDGGIYSSITDMFKWDQALSDEKLISKASVNIMWKPNKTLSGEELNYGYGWRLENFKGRKVVFHTGSTMGFRNIFYKIPTENISVIILTNRNTEDEFSTLILAHSVMDLYL